MRIPLKPIPMPNPLMAPPLPSPLPHFMAEREKAGSLEITNNPRSARFPFASRGATEIVQTPGPSPPEEERGTIGR